MGVATIRRRELKLRVTELKGKDMLDKYIENHAEDKAYEVRKRRNRPGPSICCPTFAFSFVRESQEAFAQEAGL